MKQLKCRLFGCNWRYFFTCSDCYNKRTDIRICKCCGKVQHYMKIASLQKEEFVWMNMIGFTKFGAKKHWHMNKKATP